jgi:hypothetical protein
MFRVEHILIVVGVVIALAGAALIYDARRDEHPRIFRDRRRRVRAVRNRLGEALIGGGMVLFGAALIGGELWRYATVAVIAGFLSVAIGAVLNRDYLRELLLFRGSARRASGDERSTRPPDDGGPRPRIR